ncbi:MAG: hypothetical protein IJV01_06165 [Bacteroidales bacterium]|nr:hypothetical protein [Bacteroidales bacterium]
MFPVSRPRGPHGRTAGHGTPGTLASSRPDNHANNAEFGVEKARGASFPLLYVTNGKVGSDIEWTCYVESISRKGKNFRAELAQTIVLDISGWATRGYDPIFGAPSWLIDRERKALWVFSAHKRTTPQVTRTAAENRYIATRFRIYDTDTGAVQGYDLQQQIPQEMEDLVLHKGVLYVNVNARGLPPVYCVTLP